LIRSLRERKNGLSQHRSQTETLRSLKYGNDPGVVDTCGARSLTVPRKTRHYARSLSNGLQLPKEVSLHTANGVGEDQIVGLGIFGDHPVPQFVHERRGNGQLDHLISKFSGGRLRPFLQADYYRLTRHSLITNSFHPQLIEVFL
jgi:hypothetical protein